MPAMSWSSTGKTSCKTAARSIPPRRPQAHQARKPPMERNSPPRSRATRNAGGAVRKLRSKANPPGRRNESIQAVHFAASRDHLADGGDFARGFVAYRQLPVSALPQVDYPTIQVQTFYPGASPDVMASSVTAPLERPFGQVPGLNQITSTSSYRRSVITPQFYLDLNIAVPQHEGQAS